MKSIGLIGLLAIQFAFGVYGQLQLVKEVQDEFPVAAVNNASSVYANASDPKLSDDELFHSLTGSYSMRSLSNETDIDGSVKEVLLRPDGIMIRSYYNNASESGIGYTYGLWRVGNGFYQEILNKEDAKKLVGGSSKSDSAPASLNNTGSTLTYSGKPLTKLNPDGSSYNNRTKAAYKLPAPESELERLSRIFGTFRTNNCLKDHVNTVALSVNGQYAVTMCIDGQPLSLEYGTFIIESFTNQTEVGLVLYNNNKLMLNEEVNLNANGTLTYNEALLYPYPSPSPPQSPVSYYKGGNGSKKVPRPINIKKPYIKAEPTKQPKYNVIAVKQPKPALTSIKASQSPRAIPNANLYYSRPPLKALY